MPRDVMSGSRESRGSDGDSACSRETDTEDTEDERRPAHWKAGGGKPVPQQQPLQPLQPAAPSHAAKSAAQWDLVSSWISRAHCTDPQATASPYWDMSNYLDQAAMQGQMVGGGGAAAWLGWRGLVEASVSVCSCCGGRAVVCAGKALLWPLKVSCNVSMYACVPVPVSVCGHLCLFLT